MEMYQKGELEQASFVAEARGQPYGRAKKGRTGCACFRGLQVSNPAFGLEVNMPIFCTDGCKAPVPGISKPKFLWPPTPQKPSVLGHVKTLKVELAEHSACAVHLHELRARIRILQGLLFWAFCAWLWKLWRFLHRSPLTRRCWSWPTRELETATWHSRTGRERQLCPKPKPGHPRPDFVLRVYL